MKCWICGEVTEGLECAKCGPAQPWGPTPDELRCHNFVLNEDGERVCECGDEGRMCEACANAEAAYWLAQYQAAPLSERDPDAYEEQMRDAGRGHLLP